MNSFENRSTGQESFQSPPDAQLERALQELLDMNPAVAMELYDLISRKWLSRHRVKVFRQMTEHLMAYVTQGLHSLHVLHETQLDVVGDLSTKTLTDTMVPVLNQLGWVLQSAREQAGLPSSFAHWIETQVILLERSLAMAIRHLPDLSGLSIPEFCKDSILVRQAVRERILQRNIRDMPLLTRLPPVMQWWDDETDLLSALELCVEMYISEYESPWVDLHRVAPTLRETFHRLLLQYLSYRDEHGLPHTIDARQSSRLIRCLTRMNVGIWSDTITKRHLYQELIPRLCSSSVTALLLFLLSSPHREAVAGTLVDFLEHASHIPLGRVGPAVQQLCRTVTALTRTEDIVLPHPPSDWPSHPLWHAAIRGLLQRDMASRSNRQVIGWALFERSPSSPSWDSLFDPPDEDDDESEDGLFFSWGNIHGELIARGLTPNDSAVTFARHTLMEIIRDNDEKAMTSPLWYIITGILGPTRLVRILSDHELNAHARWCLLIELTRIASKDELQQIQPALLVEGLRYDLSPDYELEDYLDYEDTQFTQACIERGIFDDPTSDVCREAIHLLSQYWSRIVSGIHVQENNALYDLLSFWEMIRNIPPQSGAEIQASVSNHLMEYFRTAPVDELWQCRWDIRQLCRRDSRFLGVLQERQSQSTGADYGVLLLLTHASQ